MKSAAENAGYLTAIAAFLVASGRYFVFPLARHGRNLVRISGRLPAALELLFDIQEVWPPGSPRSLSSTIQGIESVVTLSRFGVQTLCDLQKRIVFFCDAAGDMTWVSREWEAVTGIPSHRAMGQGWRQAVADEWEVVEEWEAAVTELRDFYKTHNLGVHRVKTQALVVRRTDGKVVGWFGVCELADAAVLSSSPVKPRRSPGPR